mmetsp:Transcript_41364/g.67092  ORF Transcript_41364/g.67092 Transcript_41364/m.67092 type:complete len:149 (-) Transcript_41364:891-1337(-)|eukprot:CAMPEP_0184644320 /NCGR_PEP_ID=MMETSP0308-20130426/1058_1 /TAXON_ID=38269 /ORGANISM="Gloeochaete witrockiana, Strain SAG 46.84" /LENGTH=148 /DNA_ID=CAMNT_0027072783 /DNA_START=175 /DNA_END=621 /DNA_ORIENTATION=+
MPKYYCDYCDVFLTHDSYAVRKQHNNGLKHKNNVKAYYAQFEEQQTQDLIDRIVKDAEAKKAQGLLGPPLPFPGMPGLPPIGLPPLLPPPFGRGMPPPPISGVGGPHMFPHFPGGPMIPPPIPAPGVPGMTNNNPAPPGISHQQHQQS